MREFFKKINNIDKLKMDFTIKVKSINLYNKLFFDK